MRYSKYIFMLCFLLLNITIFNACSRPAINFVISFESNGGSDCTPIESTDVQSIRMPDDPTKEGYTFLGWYWDDRVWQEKFTINSLLDQPLSARMDLHVYARWLKYGDELPEDVIQPEGEIPSFTRFFVIQFDSNGGTTEDSISSENLSTALIPSPTKEHFIFQGWFWDDGNPFTYNSINDRPLTEFPNLTVFAKWKGVDCTINLNTNGGTVSSDSQTVTYMSQNFTLPAPTKDESVFDGWYFDSALTKKAADGGVGSLIIYKQQWENINPTMLYAKWSPKPYQVLLYTEIGIIPNTQSQYHTITTYKGQAFNMPNPVSEGYTFIGWFTQPWGGENGKKITNGYTYDGEFEFMYAHWQIKTYNIRFDEKGGSAVNDLVIEYYSDVYLGEDDYLPEKKGCAFEGWYYNGERVYSYYFYPYDHDITLTAQWRILGHEVTFIAGDGFRIDGRIGANGWFGGPNDFIASYTHIYDNGDSLIKWVEGSDTNFKIYTMWVNSEYRAYEFIGWYTEPDGQGEYYAQNTIFYDYMPKTITLYAHFRQSFGVDFVASATGKPWEDDAKLLVQYSYSSSLFETEQYSRGYNVGDTLCSTNIENYFTITAVKDGYKFMGWYTQLNGKGEQYTDDMVFTTKPKSCTLYAYFVPESE